MKNDVENASASNTDEDTESDRSASGIQPIWQFLAILKKSPPHEDRADECCIYRVPNSLRVSNPEAYTPQLISIGPFHHRSDERLEAMETLKRRYQGEFLKRNDMDGNKIIDFITRIRKEEESVRLCYSETFGIQTERFVKMIVLDAVFIIEFLKVDDSLERVVRNVMAWEQCSKPDEAYISNYFKFMDHLIDRAEDVALLAEEGIIINWLDDDAAVSRLMNNLSQRSETTSYYSDICGDLNGYYENPWNRRRATLKLVYFNNLWRGTGTLAAAFLLILTLLQTITSLKSAF